MTINDEILTAANKLANQGIKPTVALVKTKLSQPVPLPTIISVLKAWQHNPEFISPEQTEAANISKSKQSEIEQLITAAIAPLSSEIAALKKEIQALKKHIESRK